MRLIELLPTLVTIPAGVFLMGTPEHELGDLSRAYGGTRESYREESPQHTITLPAFQIARTPVTNRLYAAYVAATGARPPILWHADRPPAALLDHPVVDVNWNEVVAFCVWLSVELGIPGDGSPAIAGNFRLPSEAEWERAARSVDGRRFPWGDRWEQPRAATRESGLRGTMPVGSYPDGASADGCLDMAGTVWEWTASLDRPYPYDPADGREDRNAAGRRILRGGCYAHPHGYARCACRFRLPPPMHNEFLGFRLARAL